MKMHLNAFQNAKILRIFFECTSRRSIFLYKVSGKKILYGLCKRDKKKKGFMKTHFGASKNYLFFYTVHNFFFMKLCVQR